MQKKFNSLTDVKAEGFDCFLTAQSPMRTVVQSETSHAIQNVSISKSSNSSLQLTSSSATHLLQQQ